MQTTGPAGDMLTVLDERHAPVPNAAAWLDGRKYTVNEKTGRIHIPFTEEAGRGPIILTDASGEFATLATFEHHDETYALEAEFHIDREQLLARREATLAIRTTLRLGQTPVALGLLLEPRLKITATTLDGISTTREIKGLHLDPAKVFLQTFTVPDRLATLDVELSGRVENISQGGEKKEVTATHQWKVNGIDRTEDTNDGHFSLFGKRTIFELLGKNGEPLADQAVAFRFSHQDFDRDDVKVEVELRTNERGRIDLGELEGISRVEANLKNERMAWADFEDGTTFSKTIHILAGEDIELPWLGDAKLTPANVSLLEERGSTFVKNRLDVLHLAGGALVIKGLGPGDYRLRLRDEQDEEILIRVTAGVSAAGWLAGPNRMLEKRNPAPVIIQSATVQPEAIVVQLRNVNPFTRVHVTATRFMPGENLFQQLGDIAEREPGAETVARQTDLFVSGRLVGDEYRYILERRYASKYPGNMLARPGLILDPWEVRTTDTRPQSLAASEPPSAAVSGSRGVESMTTRSAGGGNGNVVQVEEDGPNLDFLATTSRVLYNLVPDAQGVVRIDRKLLGDRQDVQIYAEDLESAELKEIGLPEQPVKFQDLRLARNLDPQKHFTESKEASVLGAGQTLVLEDLLSSELETYESLAAVHGLFTALNPDANLARFAWILEWPKMKDEEKRAKYSEFACHELNFFLAHKDPDFFRKVLQPYLRNKKDKTFMDDWLIEADQRRYLEPWAYGRLNLVERALLGQRIPAEAAAAARHLRDLWEVLPPQPELEDRLFETALHGQAMAGKGDLEKAQVAFAAEPAQLSSEEKESVASTKVALPAGGDAKEWRFRGGGTAGTPSGANQDGFSISAATNLGRAISPNAIDALLDAPALLAAPAAAPMPLSAATTYSASDPAAHALHPAVDFSDISNDVAMAQELRGEVRQFYRKIGATKEWAENNYYQLPIAQQEGSLIGANAYWRDYAAWDGKAPFLSPHWPEASRNFSEMMLALAVLDLPFEAPKAESKAANGQFTITAAGPLIAFRQEIRPAQVAPPGGDRDLLVSENFFRQDDRYRTEGNEKYDKYVTGEFLAGVAYGANVVVTNAGSPPRKLEVLLQIPRGALPVLGSKVTESKRVRLEPYTTQKFEYFFYFPAPAGEPFPHYPAQVAHETMAAGSAKVATFKVVKLLSEIDKTSWDYISQEASEAEVLAFLEKSNLERLGLERIAWRARKSASFFHKLISLLEARHVYSEVIYRYALLHNATGPLREWLRHRDDFVALCGPYLASKLVTIEPVERHEYEHLEYAPLINQRLHRLGAENTIANPVLRGQYQALLRILAHKPQPEPADELSVVYYLFLQDRIAEALARFAAIQAGALCRRGCSTITCAVMPPFTRRSYPRPAGSRRSTPAIRLIAGGSFSPRRRRSLMRSKKKTPSLDSRMRGPIARRNRARWRPASRPSNSRLRITPSR